MQSQAETVNQYIEELPQERKDAVKKLRSVILENLPQGFHEQMNYGMIGYVVPHSLYPAGYHVDPKQPLHFLSLASQKNSINLYHSGIYCDPDMEAWFKAEYPKYVKTKLDMGKSCIRFKNPDTIPYKLIGELVSRMTPQEWIKLYEDSIKRK